MSCPSSGMLSAWVDGQLALELQQRLTQHVQGCQRCLEVAERQRRLTGDLALLTLAKPAPQFVAQVRERMSARPNPARARHHLLPLAAGAALLLAAFGLGLRSVLPVAREEAAGFAARGGRSQQPLAVEIIVHEPGAATLRLQAGQRVSVRAGYSFVLSNFSRTQQYLMLFAVDARSQVHWFYPAFLRTGTDPQSIAVAAEPQVHALPEGVTPAEPAAGPVQFVAVFSHAPMHVSKIETLLDAGGLPALRKAYPDVHVDVQRAELYAP